MSDNSRQAKALARALRKVYNTIHPLGVSPSGKARDSESRMHRFESYYPCVLFKPLLTDIVGKGFLYADF